MSVQAYQRAQQTAETPRDTEYRLLGQITAALTEAEKAGRGDFARLVKAVDWNRRVWTAFSVDCQNPDNGLPVQLRANIISLALFVGRYSSEVIRDGADLEVLIDINKTVMQGLAPRQGASAAPAASL
jgi:flagellar biosynthesis activator protein FlaF